ncbi:protein lethal(2)essential for life-like [Euwallacea similis]|uniref:protein lethal(2)essential for life-like n=1 Tax=Euwallacea similis TaxID=1736056 RepID=UPI00344C640E
MEFFLPFFIDQPVCPVLATSSRLLDQHFGNGLDQEDLRPPVNPNRKELSRTPAGYLRRWRSRNSSNDAGSTLVVDKEKFQANLDVQQFKSEELSVRLTEDSVLTIEGKHEEKQDEHGYISRHFVRRYLVPKGYDVGRIESKLSSDGILSIIIPAEEVKMVEHKSIPVEQTEKSVKQVNEQKN